MTYIVLHSFLNEVPCHSILDIENKVRSRSPFNPSLSATTSSILPSKSKVLFYLSSFTLPEIPYYELQNELSTSLSPSLSLLVLPLPIFHLEIPSSLRLLPQHRSRRLRLAIRLPHHSNSHQSRRFLRFIPPFLPSQIACSTENGFFHLWSSSSSSSSQPVHHLLLGHTDVVTDFDFSRDSLYLLSCALDGSIKLWSTELHRCLVNYRSFSVPLWHIRFYPENSCFACVGGRGMLYNYNTSDVQVVSRVLPRITIVTALLLLADTTVIGYRNGDVLLLRPCGFSVSPM